METQVTENVGSPNLNTVAPRAIDGIYRSPELHWVGDGFRVAGYFNVIPDAVRKLDPFLLLDYHPPYDYAPSEQPRGVGVHPHRGFETVTLAFDGSVSHHDSAGGGGTIGTGDVQWMTAAGGVLHKEYHSPEFAKNGGRFHMAQLWVNLPRAHKMDAPRYQPLLASDMGQVKQPGVDVRVVAGEFAGVKGPAKTFSPINLYDVKVSAGATFELDFAESQTLAVLVMNGEVEVQNAKAVEGDFVLFKREGTHATFIAKTDTRLLVLNGEPLKEPVVQYGPFVMNSEAEIRKAFIDFSRGAFGYLED